MLHEAASTASTNECIGKVLETALGQLLALIAFFAFPALQYISLKWFSRNEGHPQLWYLPKFGFRLVIRNLPRKKTLSTIKYRAILRTIIPHSKEATVATLQDHVLVQNEDFFVFPGTDQILVNFQLRGEDEKEIVFVLTDKLGHEKEIVPLHQFDFLICDYTAILENVFSFNVRLSKRSEVSTKSLESMWRATQSSNPEDRFPIDRIRTVG